MAVIPPRKNASHWKKSSPGSAHRNEAIRACQRLGRGIWKKWSGYHRRSLVETKMHCFKRLGERVIARTFDRQVVELHVRVALLNRFSQIGRPHTVSVIAVASVRLGLGLCRPKIDLCNRAPANGRHHARAERRPSCACGRTLRHQPQSRKPASHHLPLLEIRHRLRCTPRPLEAPSHSGDGRRLHSQFQSNKMIEMIEFRLKFR
ncbi:hypothetical protein AVAK2825_23310 [Acidovorax sp. SUPP2825]|nr:hypothetical protein AVAK2825_23310 [Acidovorax sp. SUPP2825]